MAIPKIILIEDAYMLEVGEERSEPVPFGLPIEVELGGSKYLAMVDLPEGTEEASDVESLLNSWVYRIAQEYGDEVELVEEDADDDLDGGDDTTIEVGTETDDD